MRQKESPPIESRGSEKTPLCSKLSLRGDLRSGPSPRLGQKFMSKGLSVYPLLRFSLTVRALPRTFTETVLQS